MHWHGGGRSCLIAAAAHRKVPSEPECSVERPPIEVRCVFGVVRSRVCLTQGAAQHGADIVMHAFRDMAMAAELDAHLVKLGVGCRLYSRGLQKMKHHIAFGD